MIIMERTWFDQVAINLNKIAMNNLMSLMKHIECRDDAMYMYANEAVPIMEMISQSGGARHMQMRRRRRRSFVPTAEASQLASSRLLIGSFLIDSPSLPAPSLF